MRSVHEETRNRVVRVLVSGGGTAGHIYPALTVAERLVAEHDEVVFVGTPNGFESRLVPERGVRFEALEASGYDRARPLTLVTSSVRIAALDRSSLARIGAQRPDVVIGFGGYVSIPVGFAAVLRGVPLVLHEQNSVPGLANRVLSAGRDRWASHTRNPLRGSPILRVHGSPGIPSARACSTRAGRRGADPGPAA